MMDRQKQTITEVRTVEQNAEAYADLYAREDVQVVEKAFLAGAMWQKHCGADAKKSTPVTDESGVSVGAGVHQIDEPIELGSTGFKRVEMPPFVWPGSKPMKVHITVRVERDEDP